MDEQDDFDPRGEQQPDAGGTAVAEQPPPQQQQQPDWSQIATSMPTWNQADEIDLQRLVNGASYIRNRAINGRNGPETTQSLNDQLNQHLGPLMARKAAAAQFAKQQQKEDASDQMSFTQAATTANMRHNASVFGETMHREYNPATGGFDVFYQHKPGEWSVHPSQPPDLGQNGGGEEESGGGDGGATPGESDRPTPEEGPAPKPGPATDVAQDGQPYGETPRTIQGPHGPIRIPTAAEHAAMIAASPAEQPHIAESIANGTFGQTGAPGGPTMSIQNGGYKETFENGQLTSTNRPAPQSQSAAADDSSPGPALQDQWRKQAIALTAGMRNGPHRDHTIGQIIAHKSAAWDTKRQHAEDAANRERATAARATAADKNKKTVDQTKDYGATLKHFTDKRVSEWHAANKTDDGKAVEMPADVREGIRNKALADADQHHIDVHGEDALPEPRKQARQAKADEGTPAPKNFPHVINGPSGPVNIYQDEGGQVHVEPVQRPKVPVPAQGGEMDRYNRLKDLDAKTHAEITAKDQKRKYQRPADYGTNPGRLGG